jgi:hypothetical protein
MRPARFAWAAGDLFETMDRVQRRIEPLRRAAMSPDDAVHHERICAAVEAVIALRRRDVRLLPRNQVALALVDAEALARIVDAIGKRKSCSGALEVPAVLSDRIMRSIGYLALVSGGDTPLVSAGDHVTSPDASARRAFGDERGQRSANSQQALEKLAGYYGRDAQRENRVMRMIYVASLLVLLGGVALAIVGIGEAAHGNEFDVTRFAAHGVVSLTVVAVSWLTLREAGRHHLAEQEARRLERQLRALHPYLSELPSELRALLRGTLVPSFFSRLPNEEPWREPQWPPATLLKEMTREASPLTSPQAPSGLLDRLYRRAARSRGDG